MPRIPDSNALGRVIPQGRAPIVSDQSAEIMADAVGRGASQLRLTADAYQHKQDSFSYAKAKASLLTADIEARKALENDQDWETHETRYQEAMKPAREKAAGLIRSNRDRALFDMDAKLDIERSLGAVRRGARRIEVDKGRADLDSMLTANRNAALEAKDDETRNRIAAVTMDAIAGASERGYVDSETAGKIGRAWTADYAEGFVGMKSPEERLALLNKPGVADYLAPDKRQAMKVQAQQEGRELRVRGESQKQSDKLVQSGDMGSALSVARDIADPEVRDATTTRIKAHFAEAEAVKRQRSDALFDGVMDKIEQGGTRDSIPTNQWLALEPEQRRAVEQRLVQKAGGTEPKTDWSRYYALRDQAATNPQEFAKQNLLTSRTVLSDTEFKQMVDLQSKIKDGTAEVALAGIRTQKDVVEGALNQLGIKRGQNAKLEQNARAERFEVAVDERVRALQTEIGKKATPTQVQEIVNGLTTEVAINRSYWFDTEKPAFDVTIEDIPQADRADIERALQARGKPITDEAVIELYALANRK